MRAFEYPVTHLVSDCDGVLIDSEAVALDALLAMLSVRAAHVQIKRLEALITPRLGMQIEPLLADLFAELDLPPISEADTAAMRDQVEAQCDLRLSAVPGVAQALAAIRLPKAVASNSPRDRVRSALHRTALAPLFDDRIYTPDWVGFSKPHPGVYLAAASGFDVAPSRCVVLEDSVTGVTAAAAAGMYVLGFTGGGHIAEGQAQRLREAGAHDTFSDMTRLPALIEALSRPR